MIYLGSSALLKLLFEESESAALALWISERAGTLVRSELAKVEGSPRDVSIRTWRPQPER